MNRGNITPRPQLAPSYSNPGSQAPQNQPPAPSTITSPMTAWMCGFWTTVTILPQ